MAITKKMRAKLKKNKMDLVYDIVCKNMDKLDNMMNKASKDIRATDSNTSSHILSSQIIRHLAANMAHYYDVNKVRELFQEILDEESTHAVIKAKQDRENCTLDTPKGRRYN